MSCLCGLNRLTMGGVFTCVTLMEDVFQKQRLLSISSRPLYVLLMSPSEIAQEVKVTRLASHSETGMSCKATGIRPQRGRGYTPYNDMVVLSHEDGSTGTRTLPQRI